MRVDTGSIRFLVAIWITIIWSISTAYAQQRRLGNGTADDADYGKKWALIIGINYDHRDDLRLKNPENDARAVAKVLCDNYGYVGGESSFSESSDQTLFTLIGEQATLENIRNAFNEEFLANTDRVRKDDSVLIFFAGHGDRTNGNSRKALLFPWDVKDVDGGGINSSSCINIKHMLEDLAGCEAKHKLVILDSCHSGDIFNLAHNLTRSSPKIGSIDPALFDKPVVQALTASTGDQRAIDGLAEHSPFTQALLEALDGPLIRRSVFGASALIAKVPERVRQINQELKAPLQSPRGGMVNNYGDGEFYFFRQSETPPDMSVAINFDLQTLPSLNGKWWFDETPWLVPQARAQLSGQPELRDVLVRLTRPPAEETRVAVLKPPIDGETIPRPSPQAWVLKLIKDQVAEYVDKQPVDDRRLLRMLFEFHASDYDDDQKQRLLEMLESISDKHLKALIHHKFDLVETEGLYLEALRSYETRMAEAGDERVGGLSRLCWADRGVYLCQAGLYAEAVSAFREARAAETLTPPMFLVYSLIWESRALVKLNKWQEGEQTLKRALGLAEQKLSLDPVHPLIPAIHDAFAWMYMDHWRLDDAIVHFREAAKLREDQHFDDVLTKILVLHDEHGLAMALRFMGRYDEAQAQYRSVYEKLAELWETNESKETREVLAGRIVNTLERLGDSYLFAVPASPFDANEAYIQSTEFGEGMPPSLANRMLARVRLKRAAALAVGGDPEEALREFQDVKQTQYDRLSEGQRPEIDLYCGVAEGVALLAQGSDGGRQQIRDLLSDAVKGGSSARQQLELLLFAARELLQNPVSPEQAKSDSRLLFDLVPRSFVSTTNLPFLRPYFDLALGSQLQDAKPTQIPRLMSWIVLAKTAGHYSRPRDKSVVLFYLQQDTGHVIIFPRRDGASKRMLPSIESLDFGAGNLESASLSDQLVEKLEKVPGPINVQWWDRGLAQPLTNDNFPFKEVSFLTLTAEPKSQESIEPTN